jgi:hypothetical protein
MILTVFIKMVNMVGKLCFANRLNDIILFLSDSLLDESKKMLKDNILKIVPAECDTVVELSVMLMYLIVE